MKLGENLYLNEISLQEALLTVAQFDQKMWNKSHKILFVYH